MSQRLLNMGTTLYSKAKELLTQNHAHDFLDTWNEFELWLENSSVVTRPWPENGMRLAENIRREAHLLSNLHLGNPEEIYQFMLFCIDKFKSAHTETDKVNCFISACKKFARKGKKIDPTIIPATIHRYVDSEWPLKSVANVLAEYVYDNLSHGLMSFELATEKLKMCWDASLIQTLDDSQCIAHPSNDIAFATFEDGTLTNASDAKFISECLALPCAIRAYSLNRTRNLFKLIYPCSDVVNHQFPTFADVENFPYFEPIGEDSAELGKTRPLCGGPSQPEFIHKNTSLNILSEPIVWVGEFTV